FSLLDLQHFVTGRGYRGSAYRHLGFDDLRVFHAPIVPINQHGYNHYVVFNGVTGDRVLLADPAFGNRTLSIAGFIAVWAQAANSAMEEALVTKGLVLLPSGTFRLTPSLTWFHDRQGDDH
ncbi:MAG TPA: cysteine peptidase family C39 domain-containing protein, partial [Lamprocystis sp. (in: g-proteobacteria)]|nr:cysteine peptidase family C39 domain-containing protein [Lamprocystis sp. (in: g-proteobacteria)]